MAPGNAAGIRVFRLLVLAATGRTRIFITQACNGCDVLIHEVMSPREVDGPAPEWRRYHRTSHTRIGGSRR